MLGGLTLAGICGFWLWQRRKIISSNETVGLADRTCSASCYPPPPHYSRCSSFNQTLPPPYNEVTGKPDLYPLVIGFDEGIGKGPSSFVMRYSSTFDSLNSSFMCNVVNEANTIIPPPYSIDSCNNSIDELSTMGCDRVEIGDGSFASLANNRTTSDISSLAAQSPCSPPRATSPTIELRELLDKIQQLPHDPPINRRNYQNRPQALNFFGIHSPMQDPAAPGEYVHSRIRRTRGKTYMPLGHQANSVTPRNKTKRWLSRSAPTTPSGTIPLSLGMTAHNPLRPADTNYHHQQVPLLSEQDENYVTNCPGSSPLAERDEQL